MLRPIPSVAMIAVGGLIMSVTSDRFGLLVAFIGSLWPYTVAALDAFRLVPRALEESAITLGKTRRQYILQVLFPAALPSLFAAVRLVMPIVLLLTVTTQYIFQGLEGLGALLYSKQNGMQYPLVIATVAVLAFVGYGIETLVELAELKTVRWKRAYATDL
jgi:NitT/TauT family transport system permease protein